MQTITAQLDAAFRTAIFAALGIDADPLIAAAQNDKFGDYQSNAAMGLAKQMSQSTGQKTNPRQIAEQVKGRLQLGDMASDISIAGPGFINVRLNPAWIGRQLEAIADDGRLGIDPIALPRRVVIDYSSPNVAKQMHVGHLRPTNIGDAISRIIEFQGHDVIRQNHLGDWGTQFGMLLRYLKESDAGAESHIADLEAFYKTARKRFDGDTAFADEARQMVVRLQGGDEEAMGLWRRIMDESRRHFQAVYERMNIKLRRADERGESFYNPLLADVVKELTEKGVAVESEGAMVIFVKGFEAPLMIRKSGGGFGYGTTDLAAVRFRVRDLGGTRLVYVTDARQAQHFRQVFDAAQRAGWADEILLEHVMFGMILGPDQTPLKTRAGETVKLIDLLEEAEQRSLAIVQQKLQERGLAMGHQQQRAIARAVGIGAIKYFDLNRDPIGNYVFDWEQMLSLVGNTAPYLQYAYARIRAIFRKESNSGGGTGGPPVAVRIALASAHEIALAKHILRLGEIVDLAARDLKPHYICGYLYELATWFSGFYENCPVLQSEPPVRASRLALCDITARALALGLELLGIEHPEQM